MSRFSFGKNWSDYARGISEHAIGVAEASLKAFIPHGEFCDKRMLDIGCGSGLFSLAALKLGVGQLTAVDYDPDSVRTTCQLLEARWDKSNWECRQGDILTMVPNGSLYDIVFSWGVLHHTGNLNRAIQNASAWVKPGGKLLIAIYGKTPFCAFWRWEKRQFVRHPRFAQLVRPLYKTAFLAGLMVKGQNPRRYIRDYAERRGMSWHHDIEDWLGGYPYESESSDVLIATVEAQSFTLQKSKVQRRLGLVSSGCDEYLFTRHDDPSPKIQPDA